MAYSGVMGEGSENPSQLRNVMTYGISSIVPISIMAFFIALVRIPLWRKADTLNIIYPPGIHRDFSRSDGTYSVCSHLGAAERWWEWKTIILISLHVLHCAGHRVWQRAFSVLLAWHVLVLTAFSSQDPVILSATPFIAYMTQASANIKNPRAWIYAQFACANIGNSGHECTFFQFCLTSCLASAILVSSNPTNLVLSGAFSISYITYTANMIVPVVFTIVILYPILVYFIFTSDDLIPQSINMHALPGEIAEGTRPNGTIELGTTDPIQISMTRTRSRNVDIDLKAILHPYLERRAATFCVVLFVTTLTVLLATNAAGLKIEVYAITVPAAFVMLCRDLLDDWVTLRKESNDPSVKDMEAATSSDKTGEKGAPARALSFPISEPPEKSRAGTIESADITATAAPSMLGQLPPHTDEPETYAQPAASGKSPNNSPRGTHDTVQTTGTAGTTANLVANNSTSARSKDSKSLESIIAAFISLLQRNFPRACTVISQLPFGLLPFTFGMFILVQGLVTKGWVQIFANGWQGWVNKTGTLGAIGGMGVVSVLLCNVCVILDVPGNGVYAHFCSVCRHEYWDDNCPFTSLTGMVEISQSFRSYKTSIRAFYVPTSPLMRRTHYPQSCGVIRYTPWLLA